MKQCTQCKLHKSLLEFSAHRLGKSGKHPWCKPCHRIKTKSYYKAKSGAARTAKIDKDRQRMYGIGSDTYERLLGNQSGLCAICGQPERFIDKRTGQTRRLSIDHCHKTGAVRGLLCYGCNTSLGHFKDSQHLLRAAANYLERSAAISQKVVSYKGDLTNGNQISQESCSC